MATNAILIQWGIPVPGRERMALEEFASYMQWANQLKSRGEIDRFEVYAPHSGNYQHFTGFTVLEGNETQIQKVITSDDFRQRIDRVLTVAQNVRVERCDVGALVNDRMKLYGKALQQLKL